MVLKIEPALYTRHKPEITKLIGTLNLHFSWLTRAVAVLTKAPDYELTAICRLGVRGWVLT